MADTENVKQSDSIRALADAVQKSPSYTDSDLLELSFEPKWINNVTRLNQQNLQIKLYECLKKNYQTTGTTVSKDIYEKLNRIVTFLGGTRSDPQSNSEVHNNEVTFETNNTAAGKYQSVFGQGNTSDKGVDGQFIIGTYADSKKDENSLFIVGVGTTEGRDNAVVIKTDGTTKFYKDVQIPSLTLENNLQAKAGTFENLQATTGKFNILEATTGITSKVIKITGVIPEVNSDWYAVNKKYVDTAIKNVNAISIRNVDANPIETTLANVQKRATDYIHENYGGRDPKNLEGLILTITDGPSGNPDRILFIYSDITNAWINAGINSVDLSNFYNKDEINNMLEWQDW